MSGGGAPGLAGSGLRPSGQPWRVAVVASQWHQEITDALVAGAKRVLERSGAQFCVVRVPGAFELPLGAQWALTGGNRPDHSYSFAYMDGVVALGVVIRGGTPHFEYVCEAATSGLARVALDTAKPVGFGLLTCDNEAEAVARAGLEGSSEDKGAEAAEAVLAMLGLSVRPLSGPAR